jgi:hypothetical protein
VEVDNEPSALQAVADHRADYAVVPSIIGYEALRRFHLTDIVALSPAFFDTGYAFAINAQRPDWWRRSTRDCARPPPMATPAACTSNGWPTSRRPKRPSAPACIAPRG